jgi:hypothetical protein
MKRDRWMGHIVCGIGLYNRVLGEIQKEKWKGREEDEELSGF